MKTLYHLLARSAAVVFIAHVAQPAMAVVIDKDTVAFVNDNVIINATDAIQTNAFAKELSINDPDNDIVSVGVPNPGATGSLPVYTNDPANALVTLADLAFDGTHFLVHFNQNEPPMAGGAGLKVTLNDVVLIVNDTVIWNYDEVTHGAIVLNSNPPNTTAGANNNHSDVIFFLPLNLFTGMGFTNASHFEIFWTVSDTGSTGTPEQWAIISGQSYDFGDGGGQASEPAVLGIAAAGMGGLLLMRRRNR